MRGIVLIGLLGCSFKTIIGRSTGPDGLTVNGPPTLIGVQGDSTTQAGRVHAGLLLSGENLSAVTDVTLEPVGLAFTVVGTPTNSELHVTFTDAQLAAVSAGQTYAVQAKAPLGTSAIDVAFQRGEPGASGTNGLAGTNGADGTGGPQVQGTCSGSLVAGLGADGSLSCQAFTGAVAATGRSYAVTPFDFRVLTSGTSNLPWARDTLSIAPDGTSNQSPFMVAPFHLPDSALLTGFGCWVVDNDVSVDLTILLTRQNGASQTNCTNQVGTTGNQIARQLLTASILPACQAPVTNAATGAPQSDYSVLVSSTGTTAVHMCYVNYQLSVGLP